MLFEQLDREGDKRKKKEQISRPPISLEGKIWGKFMREGKKVNPNNRLKNYLISTKLVISVFGASSCYQLFGNIGQ